MNLNKLRIFAFRLSDLAESEEGTRNRKRNHLIAISGLLNVAARFLTAIIGIVTVPMTLHYMGKEEYGIWMIISSFIVWLQLTDFAFSNGLINALAEANGKDDKEIALNCIATTIVVNIAISILLSAPIVLAAMFLPWGNMLNIHSEALIKLLKLGLLTAGVIYLVNLPLGVISRVYVGYQIGFVASVAQIFSSLFSLLSLVLAIHLKLQMLWLIGFISAAPLIGNIFLICLLPVYFPWLKFKKEMINRQGWSRIVFTSAPLFVFQVGSLLRDQFANILVARQAGLTMVADLNILLKIYLLIFSIGMAIATPFYPAIREALERGDKIWVRQAITRLIGIRATVVLVPSVLLIWQGDWLLKNWLGQGLSSNFNWIGWVAFSLTLLASSIGSTFVEIRLVMDKIWGQVLIMFVSAFLNLSIVGMLVKRNGLLGVFLALFFSFLLPIVYGYFKVWRSKGSLKIPSGVQRGTI